MQIDAHQHFWNPARGDYGWMPADDPTLSRPYGPADLRAALDAAGIDQTVLVQAAPSVEETEYLLGIADATPWVAGVVGWFDFEAPGEAATWDRLAQHPKLLGIRPMIQDLPDDDWMLRADIQWGFEKLIALDLTFDALGFPRHLANFLTLFHRYPQMRVVIDHCMKPQITDPAPEAFEHWAAGMSRLASETSAVCKFSALVTEAPPDWTAQQLKPYVDHVFAAFGPERIMWGSDWPVCRLRCEYGDWRAAALSLTAHLDTAAKARVYGGTATAFYQLPLS